MLNIHSEDFRLILDGNKKQTITVPEDTKNVNLGTVELQSTSGEGVFYTGKLPVIEKQILNDVPFYINDHRVITGQTLKQDTILEENAILIGGELDLDNHALTLQKDLYICQGDLKINGGTMTVSGNCILSGEGRLTMTNEHDHVKVGGDFEVTTSESLEGLLTDGVLELHGDFRQKDATNFVATGNHETVILREKPDENHKQVIFMERAVQTHFGRLVLWNEPEKYYEMNYPVHYLAQNVIYREGSDTKPPETITQFGVSRRTGKRITLLWEKAVDNVGISGYRLYRDGKLLADHLMEQSYTDDTLEAGKKYVYTVTAYDYAGNESEQSKELIKELYLPEILSTTPADGEEIGGNRTVLAMIAQGGMYGKSRAYIEYYDETEGAWKYINGTDSDDQNISFQASWSIPYVTEVKLRFTVMDSDACRVSKEITCKVDKASPAAVTNLHATAGEGKVLLEWEKSRDEDCEGYYIYRSNEPTEEYQLLTRMEDPETESYTDTKIERNQTYYYKVFAYDKYGNYNRDMDAVSVSVISDTQPPSQVKGLKVNDRTGSTITIGWEASEDECGVQGYSVYRDGEKIAESVKETFYKDSGLKAGKLYLYKVTATDASGNESIESEGLEGACQVPKITGISPANYEIIGGKSVQLSMLYTAGGDYKKNDIQVEYRMSEEDTWSKGQGGIVTISATRVVYEWILPEVNEKRFPEVKITLTDESGSRGEKLIHYQLDGSCPDIPGNFHRQDSKDMVMLMWSQDVEESTAGYYLYRKEGSGEYTKIATISDSMTSWYCDRDVENKKEYTYKLSAFNRYGREGDCSDEVKILTEEDLTVPKITEINPSAGEKIHGKTLLTAEANDNRRIETISLYYRLENEEEWHLLTEQEASNDRIQYKWDTTLLPSGSYYVKAVARDHAGNVSKMEFLRHYVIDNTGPAKVIFADCDSSSASVLLTWQDVEDEDLAYFTVECLVDGAWEKVESTNKLGYRHKGLQAGQSYTYRVTGYDFLGNRGEESDEIVMETRQDMTEPVIRRIDPVSSSYGSKMNLSMEVRDDVSVDYGNFYYSRDGIEYILIATVENPEKGSFCKLDYKWDTSELEEGNIKVRFEAYDLAGHRSMLTSGGEELEENYTIDHTAPEEPDDFRMTDSDGAVSLKWICESKDDICVLERADKPDGDFKVLEERCTGQRYRDAQVKPDKTYYYRITATDIAGNQSTTSEVLKVTVNPDTVAPTL